MVVRSVSSLQVYNSLYRCSYDVLTNLALAIGLDPGLVREASKCNVICMIANHLVSYEKQ